MTRWRRILPAVLATGAMAVVMIVRVASVSPDPGTPAGVEIFRHPQTVAQELLREIDGQSYAQIAYDPTMAHAEREFGSKGEAAYREARPVWAWVVLAASGGVGSTRWIADVMLALAVLAVGLLAYVTTRLAVHLGRSELAGALIALLPGAAVSVYAPGGCEAFGVALAVLGWLWWAEGRRPLGLAALCVAALTRETLLLFPAAIALAALGRDLRQWRAVLPLAAPLATYVGWLLVVHARVGAWPSDAANSRLSSPVDGLFTAFGDWSSLTRSVALSLAALAVLAFVRLADRTARWLLVLHAGLALTMGISVWDSFRNFGRVLLPMGVLGIVALVPALHGEPASAPAPSR